MNVTVLIGRLTRDPDTRYTQSGKAVCNFTLAVDREFSKEKEADFINIVVWGKTAEACGNNLAKGRLVAVQGRLQVRSYDKDGSKRYMTEVIASQVQFLDWGKGKGKPEEPDPMDVNLDDLPF